MSQQSQPQPPSYPQASYPQPTNYGTQPQPTPIAYAAPAPQMVVMQAPPPVVWGECSQTVICPHCNQQVLSVVTTEPGTLTYLAAGGLCLIGCFLGCCLIPFAVDSMKDVVHTCPHCHHSIGVKRRM